MSNNAGASGRVRLPRVQDWLPIAAVLVLLAMLSGCSYWPFGKDKEATAAARETVPMIGVEVSGIDGGVADNVRNALSLGRRSCKTPRAYLGALQEKGIDEADAALRAYGYYQAEVSIAIVPTADCVSAVVSVEPGPRVVVTEVSIELTGAAKDDAGFSKRLRAAPLKADEPLNHGDYSATKALIESVALDRGYLDGRFVRTRLLVDPDAGTARAEIVYASGRRYGLGAITILQDPAFIDEALVRRFLDFEPDDPYHAAVVPRFYQVLAANDYFADVEVRPLLSTPQADTIPLEITLTERPKHQFRAGIGASTDELIRTRAGYVNRRVNRGGHRFDTELKASAIEQSLSARYRIPREHPTDEWLSFQGGLRREDVDAFKTLEAQLGVSETKRRPWDIMETRYINLNQQNFDIGGGSQETTLLLIPGMSWNKATANDALYPTRGYSAKFELRGASEALLSDTSFTRARLSTNVAYGLPAAMRVLGRLDLGWMWTADFGELPPSERFFAGGDNSIRGYDIDALGPLDSTSEVIGGRYLGVLSIELEKTIVGNWGAAAFVDAGNAFGGPGKSAGIKTGVGLGVRWRSPVGPVRIDLAHPLDGRDPVRLHLRIGPDL